MSEKEKMLAGLLYLSADPELVHERERTRRLTRAYNQTTEIEHDRRRQLLEELLGACGRNTFIEPTFRCDYGYNITVGDDFYANFDCVILDCAPVTIGHQVLFGPGVHIYTVNHPLDPEQRRAGLEIARPVTIGHNVWIGGRAILNAGVTIGDNTVVAAGSVVTRSLPANVVAAGVPCRVLKEL